MEARSSTIVGSVADPTDFSIRKLVLVERKLQIENEFSICS